MDDVTFNVTTVTTNVTYSTPEVDIRAVQLNDVINSILIYLTPFIIGIGTIGNLLSFAVLVRKSMRSRSVYFYLMLLSWADTIVLYISAFRTWFRTLFGFELLIHHSAVTCKGYWFMMGLSQHMSAWLIVLLTLDRFIAVTYPLKAASLCTGRRAGFASLGCFLVIGAYQSHVFWNIHLYDVSHRTLPMCGPLPSANFMNKGYNYLNCLTYSLLPFLMVLSLNAGIISRMKKRAFSRGNMKNEESSGTAMLASGGATDSEREITRMTTVLFLVSFTWFALTLPFAMLNVIPMKYTMGHEPYGVAVSKLVKLICFLLMWTNHSINFFLYCLSGKKLRGVIISQLCGSGFNIKKFNRQGTTATSTKTTTLSSIRLHGVVAQGNNAKELNVL